MSFRTSAALRRRVWEPTMSRVLSTSPTARTGSSCFYGRLHGAGATGMSCIAFPSAPHLLSPSGLSAVALTVARRHGSRVSRSPGPTRGRGRGRGRGRSASRASEPAGRATTAVDGTRRTCSSQDGASVSRRDADREVGEGRAVKEEEEEDVEELISPLARVVTRSPATRGGDGVVRRGSRRRGGRRGEEAEDAARLGADANDVDVEVPAEDPTAPAQIDEDYADDGGDDDVVGEARDSATDAEETRIDGVDETARWRGAPSSREGDAPTGGRRKKSLAATRALREGADADTDEIQDNDAEAAAPLHADERSTADASAMDEEAANRFLSVAFPDLAAEYAAAGPEANKAPVDDVRIDSAEVAAWRCPSCTKTWRCGVFVRTILKNSCPHCAALHSTTMAATRPDLLQVWDHTRNDPFLNPEEISADSREMVYWTCPTCRESYTARVRDRVQEKARCPSCALVRSTSAATLGADAGALQQEWHPLKNGDLRIDQLAPLDRKTKVWWLCGSCGHEWEASLAVRLSRQGRGKGRQCPACHGHGTSEVL